MAPDESEAGLAEAGDPLEAQGVKPATVAKVAAALTALAGQAIPLHFTVQ